MRGKRKLTEEQRDELRKESNEISEVLKSKLGRAFLWRLLETSGVFTNSFNTDPCTTAFNEGRRNFGLYVLELITRNDDVLFCKIMAENKKREELA